MRAALARGALLAACAAAACAARAADEAKPETRVGISLGHDWLSGALPDFREQSVQFEHRWSRRHGVGVDLGRTERFGLRDTRVALRYDRPLGERVTLSADASASPGHQILPRHAFGAGLQFELARAWLLHGRLHHSAYDGATVNQASAGVEHYFSDFSAIALAHSTRAFGRTVGSAELRFNYYYGERDAIGLLAAAGEEAVYAGSAVTLSRVRALALIGRHAISPHWGVNYSVGRTRQGNFYDKNGVHLGLQYRF
ncbi:YaiO family outer membrane beta-barrel protein [Massilia glaciei]|uniref:YaiO family outer membrane beta-barrel protein n=1 Tax=Massilia glaciei TaxID=1524097 RepID=A0A2U2HHL6_9BURK|nr:YaiO family outer membrane beta-barrel protein [Massilia glaciei]PWF45379.1 YaiO family outer membrane beta-barrel protein [Massilia glaciei]